MTTLSKEALAAAKHDPRAYQKLKRMGLDGITDGMRDVPWAILVYGPEGVGKSKLVENIDNHIHLDIEQSANWLKTKKFPTATTLQEVYEAIETLYTQDHPFKRLVIDTVGRLEAMIFQHVVQTAKKRPGGGGINTIEDFGYGKGYQIALDEWRNVIARLDELRSVRRMDILLLGHTMIRSFKNPDGPDYDRYELRLHDKAAGFVKEWCDAVLFARYEETTTKIENRVKGAMTGERVLCTQRTAAYDAKNRFNLPEQLPLNWRELETAMLTGKGKGV
jgi:RecA-family ATPase